MASTISALLEIGKDGTEERDLNVKKKKTVDSGVSSEATQPDLDEDDAEKRLARSRERNREHARRTRLRKKAQLEALQSKVKELQAESRLLKQSVEECSIASILLGLSSGDTSFAANNLFDVSVLEENNASATAALNVCVGGKRKRFISDDAERPPQPLKLNINGRTTLIGGGKTHINWKSGVYCDESGVQQQLTQEQLENLRRERNRMHAKMTRDRKKGFISTVERTIAQLESENKRMRDTLAKQAQQHHAGKAATPSTSQVVAAMTAPPTTPVLDLVQCSGRDSAGDGHMHPDATIATSSTQLQSSYPGTMKEFTVVA